MYNSSQTELLNWGALEMARRIADGAVTSRTLVESHIARIEQVQAEKQLNAVTVRDFERALLAADEADSTPAEQRQNRALHGVPFTVKDCFAVAGLPTTLGNVISTSTLAKRDADVVARMKRAGAILLGKTNVPQLMVLNECDNPLYGKTVNPWNPDRTPGGSSGGGAAAVAAGCSPLDLGSDAGGSARVPAHFCGVHTIMPTPGSISRAGMRDGIPGLTHVTPMPAPLARTVEDLVAAVNALAECPRGRTAWIRLPDANQLSRLRVASWPSQDEFPASPAIQRAIREATDRLRDCGVEVVELSPPPLRTLVRIFASLWMADGGRTMRDNLQGSPVDYRVRRMILSARIPGFVRAAYAWHLRRNGDDWLAEIAEASRGISVAKYWKTVSQLHELRDEYMQQWCRARVDAVLCPPYGLPAFQHGHGIELTPAACYAFWANLFALPAGVISTTHVAADEENSTQRRMTGIVGKLSASAERNSAGLPVGVQIVARPCSEHVIAALMLGIESGLKSGTGECVANVS